MISEYQMARQLVHGFRYLPQEVQVKLREGNVREAIQMLIDAGYAHLSPNVSEAERGFRESGVCSVEHVAHRAEVA